MSQYIKGMWKGCSPFLTHPSARNANNHRNYADDMLRSTMRMDSEAADLLPLLDKYIERYGRDASPDLLEAATRMRDELRERDRQSEADNCVSDQ